MMKIVTFGEILLRLKTPDHERLFQTPRFEATFGGGEANVAVSLALLGRNVSFVTALPENPVAEGALADLRRHGVGVADVFRTPNGRLGIYFLETGANQRPSLVVYDREGSAVSQVGPGIFNWPKIFSGAAWFHLTGITPALSLLAAETALEALKAAKAAGLMVSFDLNYRKKLWNYGKRAPEVLATMVPLVDVLVANEEDLQLGLGFPGPEKLDSQGYRALVQTVRTTYPNLKAVAVTLRSSVSADRNSWSAVLDGPGGFHISRTYQIDDIVDRIGGGDSFCAGLVFGLTEWPTDGARALEFAVAASCLKHSVSGDFNLVTRTEVEALAAGDGTGRVNR